jgi:hypothetical protein
MISLVLTYWNRQRAADDALEMLAACYPSLDMEVVIVDDGSPVPFVNRPGMPWPVRVVRLPEKAGPLNPCIPINTGVLAAQGDIIAISGIEMLHTSPVLGAMRDELGTLGRQGYVLAACLEPKKPRWHAHSSLAGRSVHGIPMPAWSNYHFLAMLNRCLWERAGGMDEDYRAGAGYDDADLVMRLARAGARVRMRDDLVVNHPRAGARSGWPDEMFRINKKLFVSKWGGQVAAAA